MSIHAVRTLLIGAGAGYVLGVLYFFLMWEGIKGITGKRQPYVALFLGFLGRFIIAAAVFWVIAAFFDWYALVTALLAFLSVRFDFVRRAKQRLVQARAVASGNERTREVNIDTVGPVTDVFGRE